MDKTSRYVMKHGTCMAACHGSLVLRAWSLYCVRSEVRSNAYSEFGRYLRFRDHQLIASRLQSIKWPNDCTIQASISSIDPH